MIILPPNHEYIPSLSEKHGVFMFELNKSFLGKQALRAEFSQGFEGKKRKIEFLLSTLCIRAEDAGPDSSAHSFFH